MPQQHFSKDSSASCHVGHFKTTRDHRNSPDDLASFCSIFLNYRLVPPTTSSRAWCRGFLMCALLCRRWFNEKACCFFRVAGLQDADRSVSLFSHLALHWSCRSTYQLISCQIITTTCNTRAHNSKEDPRYTHTDQGGVHGHSHVAVGSFNAFVKMSHAWNIDYPPPSVLGWMLQRRSIAIDIYCFVSLVHLSPCQISHIRWQLTAAHLTHSPLSFCCSYAHGNWHTLQLSRSHARSASCVWRQLSQPWMVILFLSRAVIRSGWPPQNDLWLSILAPCWAGDYNGVPFLFPTLPLAASLHHGHAISSVNRGVRDISPVKCGV